MSETRPPWAEEPAGPHAFLQYKNTDICLDMRCVCGESTHFDGFFAGQLRCGACGALYVSHWFITLHPVAEALSDMSSPQTTECDPPEAVACNAASPYSPHGPLVCRLLAGHVGLHYAGNAVWWGVNDFARTSDRGAE